MVMQHLDNLSHAVDKDLSTSFTVNSKAKQYAAFSDFITTELPVSQSATNLLLPPIGVTNDHQLAIATDG